MSKKKKKEEDKEVHDLLGPEEVKEEEKPKEGIFLGYHPITKEEVWKPISYQHNI